MLTPTSRCLAGFQDNNFVGCDEIECRADLLIEQIRVDMRRIETRDLMRQRVALDLGRGQILLREKQLLGDFAAGTQPPVALKGVVDEIRGHGDPKQRPYNGRRPSAHFVQDHHAPRATRESANVNTSTLTRQFIDYTGLFKIRRAARITRGSAKALLNTNQLVVFGEPVRA